MLKFLKIVVINIVTLLVLLAIVNWACGVYLKKTGYSHRDQLPNYQADFDQARAIFADYNSVQHRYEPFVGWKMLPYKGKTLTINEVGERTHDLTCGSKEKSVHFFGGSTMWGEGSDDQHTIPALYNELNPEYDVYNHAQLAYNSRQELDALISLYSKNIHPDVVVFYDGVNDAAFLCPTEIRELPAHRLVPMYREKLYVGKIGMVQGLLKKAFIENILKVSQKASQKPTPSKSPYDCISNPEKAQQIADMMIKNWEIAHEIVTNRNGKFIAVLQPAAYISNPRTDHLTLDPELGKNFQEIYKRFRQKIAERNHNWIIDLSGSFDNDEYVYIDFCHVSQNGNQIIASKISEAVKKITHPKDVTLSALYP